MSAPDVIEPRPFAAPPRMPSPERGRGPRLDLLLLIIAVVAIGGLVAAVVLLSRPAKTPPPAPAPVAPTTPAAPAAAPVKPPPAAPVAPPPVPPPAPKAPAAAEKETPAGPTPTPPALSGAALEQARKDADSAMSDLLDVRRKIDPMAPAAWSGAAWSNAVAEATLGDQAYMAKEFDAATRRFRSAAKAMQDVESAAPLAFDQLVSDGSAAITRGDSDTATRLLGAALSIRPGDAAVTKLAARAATAAEVGGHLRAGAEQEAAGQMELAYAAYTEALRLDAEYPGVKEAAQRVRARLGTGVLQKLMTDGLAAYRAGKLEDARAKFLEAKKIRPELPEIDDALRLVEDGMRLQRLETLRGQAGTHEAAEDYEPALKLYNEALAIDPALAFAKEGRLRTIQGIRIGRQLDAYLAQPESLFKEATLREAQSSLDEARSVPTPGPKLQARIGALGAAITAATTPIEVPVVSDGKTEVMLLRSGPLGTFANKTLSLKPGNHVLTGARIGFRDVRVEIQVRPGKPPAPVDVSCKEKI